VTLVDQIKAIQRHVGAEVDGIFGPRTAAKVLAELQTDSSDGHRPPLQELDARTLKTISTLDVKAQAAMTTFALLAKATAATLGCDYVAISGHRTWEEQNELYERGVTLANGGESNHNFGIAADFAVFRGKVYLDDSKPELARRVHAACAAHAKDCGLEWGGDWKRFVDPPHYELATGLSLAAKRKLYKERGSVL
jgi:peptidoglycan L-alanyl-D-glutamate endopeptidase CwlK